MSEKLKFRQIQEPMPLRLVVAPFVACVILPAIMILIAAANHHNVGLSVVITMIGILLFLAVVTLRKQMWHDGTYARIENARHQENHQ